VKRERESRPERSISVSICKDYNMKMRVLSLMNIFGLVYFFSVGLSDMSLCVITGEREVHGAPVS